jgi:hypothetical protein
MQTKQCINNERKQFKKREAMDRKKENEHRPKEGKEGRMKEREDWRRWKQVKQE